MFNNLFNLLIASLIAVCIVIGCSESEDDVSLLGSADLTQTYARIKDQLLVEDDTPVDLDAAPGAPAACPVDGNTDRFPKNRLLASYNRFYNDFDPVIEDSDQNYAVIVSRYKREQNYMIRVVGLNANLKKKRAGLKYARGFDTCQEAKDFRQLVLDDYNGVNQVAGTQAVNPNQWTLHLFRNEIADASSVLPHLRQQFKLDIQVVPPNGTPSPRAGYTRYNLMGYDETTTYATEQAARDKRKELLLDYTRGSDTKQGGYVIYFFQIATEGFPFDEWEIKGENSRPWIRGGRWTDADPGDSLDTNGIFVFNGTKHECGIKTVSIDVGRTPDYVERGLEADDPDGVLSSSNPNEVDTNGNGVYDWRDIDRNGNGDLDAGDVSDLYMTFEGTSGKTAAYHALDKRDVRVLRVLDENGNGIMELSDIDRNGDGSISHTEVYRFFHGTDVFVPRDADKYCDKVLHFEYFPRRKEGISGEIWARHRRDTWLEFGE